MPGPIAKKDEDYWDSILLSDETKLNVFFIKSLLSSTKSLVRDSAHELSTHGTQNGTLYTNSAHQLSERDSLHGTLELELFNSSKEMIFSLFLSAPGVTHALVIHPPLLNTGGRELLTSRQGSSSSSQKRGRDVSIVRSLTIKSIRSASNRSLNI